MLDPVAGPVPVRRFGQAGLALLLELWVLRLAFVRNCCVKPIVIRWNDCNYTAGL